MRSKGRHNFRRQKQAPGDQPRGQNRSRAPGRSSQSAPPGIRRIIGIHAVKETLLVRPSLVQKVFLKREFLKSPDHKSIYELCLKHKISIMEAAEPVLGQWGDSHQGVGAETHWIPQLDFAALKIAESSVLVALDEVTDPQNLGAILRSTWILGGQGIILPGLRSATLTPAACKVASGAAEHIPVLQVDAFSRELEDLKAAGFWIFGLSHLATKNIWDQELPKKIVWIIGSEEKGIRTSTSKVCEDLFTIPQVTKGGCLNASHAATVVLAESARQLGRPLR